MSDGATLYKSFPPGRGQLRIPLSSRNAALAGLSLYATCRPSAVLAQRAAWMCVSLLGARALTGPSMSWVPGETDEWEELARVLVTAVGAFDEVAGYERTDASRGGLALLLLRRGRPFAFVKLRRESGESLDLEARATEAAWQSRPRAFRVPQPLAHGQEGGWTYFAVSALPPRLHRVPNDPPLYEVVGDVVAALASIPRPAGTPAHWQPMHGDLTPWNLREISGAGLYLIDWEDSGWGPPGADATLYTAASCALRNARAQRSSDDEAIAFWRNRISGRAGDARDQRLDAQMLRALAEMGGA